MNAVVLRKRINHLLFGRKNGKNDKKLLTIVVLKEKTKYFEFLKSFTHFDVVGKWKDYVGEDNTEITIEFKDTRDDKVSKEVLRALKEYNAEVVGEEKLYAYIDDIERSTL